MEGGGGEFYYFNIRGIRKKTKKEGGSEKGRGGVKIHPFHLPWIRAWCGLFSKCGALFQA